MYGTRFVFSVWLSAVCYHIWEVVQRRMRTIEKGFERNSESWSLRQSWIHPLPHRKNGHSLHTYLLLLLLSMWQVRVNRLAHIICDWYRAGDNLSKGHERRARICKPFKEPRNRFPPWRNRFLGFDSWAPETFTTLALVSFNTSMVTDSQRILKELKWYLYKFNLSSSVELLYISKCVFNKIYTIPLQTSWFHLSYCDL